MRSIAKFSVALVVLVTSCGPEADPREDQIRRQLLAQDLTNLEFGSGGFDTLFDTMSTLVLAVLRPTLEETIGRELSHTENDRLKLILDQVFRDVYPRQLWVDRIVPIYAQVFSANELQEIIEFYQTPIGQKLLRMEPRLTRELEKAGEEIVASREEEFGERFEAEFVRAFME